MTDEQDSLSLQSKSVLLGVTGGIAAYKAVELTSKLVKLGASVNVIMTKNATHFVSPLTFQSISRNPVTVDMFAEITDWQAKHIALADKADILVVAPATANIIGKMAHGIADDMLSTTALVVKCSVLIAPAMNSKMYDNPIFQENMGILRKHNVHFVEPEYGLLACGYEGKGRLAEPDTIIQEIQRLLTIPKDFDGKTILVTAGPTREAMDPVRFISNRSSGKMGYAIAEAAFARGADVILVSGPTNLKTQADIKLINIETALQMYDAVMEHASKADVIIMAAAVSDYRPRDVSLQKIKKAQDQMTLILERNPDILSELGQHKLDKQILVGFSMETENLLDNAIQKLKKKNLDLIVANDVTHEGAGFGTDTNVVVLMDSSGWEKELPIMSKLDVAHAILDKVKSISLLDIHTGV